MLPLKIISGDILSQKADAIVIPVHKGYMRVHSGASGRFAALVGENKLKEKLSEFSEYGEIAVTDGLNSNFKNIIFICVPNVYYSNNEKSKKYCMYLRTACLKALKWADDNRLSSVCFPLIGGELFRDITEKIMTAAIRAHIRCEESCMNISLVIPLSEEPQEEQHNDAAGLKIVTGDILDYNSEATVIPITKKSFGFDAIIGMSRRMAKVGGLLKQIREIKDLPLGGIKVIDGKPLGCQSIFLAHFPYSFAEGSKNEKQTRFIVSRCCLRILSYAEKSRIKSISFPILGGMKYRDMFEKCMSEAIGVHFRSSEPCINVYLVKPVEFWETNENKPKQQQLDFSEYHGFDKNFENAVKSSGLEKSEFCRKRLNEYLSKYIDNVEALANEIGYDKGSICKFRSGKIRKPQKHRVIALAIGMRLSNEERYEFIRCAGYQYPEDERDRLVETLIHSGLKKFDEINERLFDEDPDFSLDKTIKSPSAKKTSKSNFKDQK